MNYTNHSLCPSNRGKGKSGLKLTIYPVPVSEINIGVVRLSPLFDKIYVGRLPRSATDPVFFTWMQKEYRVVSSVEKVALLLRFNDPEINLGDIAQGRIKNLLDSMFPLLGWEVGKLEDWRIRTLAVEKGTRDLKPNSVSITVWEAV